MKKSLRVPQSTHLSRLGHVFLSLLVRSEFGINLNLQTNNTFTHNVSKSKAVCCHIHSVPFRICFKNGWLQHNRVCNTLHTKWAISFLQQFHFDTFLYEHHVACVVMVGRTVAFNGNTCQLESYKKADKAAHCVHWFGAFRSWKASRWGSQLWNFSYEP